MNINETRAVSKVADAVMFIIAITIIVAFIF